MEESYTGISMCVQTHAVSDHQCIAKFIRDLKLRASFFLIANKGRSPFLLLSRRMSSPSLA